MKSLDNGAVEAALPGLEQFTPKQMFFVSNAQVQIFDQHVMDILNCGSSSSSHLVENNLPEYRFFKYWYQVSTN